jgi:tetratricopeptide (TPR) repeat protein
LVRALASSLPDTVQGVIASRIDLLPPEEKRVVQDASVVGRVFWAGAVARLGGTGAGGALEGLVAKGLVVERDTSTIAGERELIFNHILTRDVAYSSIPRARRADAHAVVGGWVEEETAGRDEEFSEILAYHFERAGDAERTARYALLAGNRHLRVFAAQQAIEWYDRALAATAETDAGRRARIGLARGGALELIGRFLEALEAYREAHVSAVDASDLGLEARSLAAHAHVLWLLDRYDEGQALLPAALERARAAGLADVEARLLYTAGTFRFGRGEFSEALPLHEQALAIAEASGDLEGQALAHHGLCETYFFVWPIETGLEHGQTADRMLRRLGQRSMVAHNAYMVAWELGFLGRWDEALAAVESSIETLGEIGNRRDEAFALQNRAELLLSAGRLDEAWRDADRGREMFRELGLPRGEIVGCNVLNDVAAEAGDVGRLSENAAVALELSDALDGGFQREVVLAFAAWAALALGDRERGERRFAEARAFPGPLGTAWSAVVELRAREWSADADGLRSVAERLERWVLPESRFWGAWAPYARARADLLDGHPDRALGQATRALELARAVRERRIEWRAAFAAAGALEAMGRHREAVAFRDDAIAIVRSFAACASGGLREAFLARPDVAGLLA